MYLIRLFKIHAIVLSDYFEFPFGLVVRIPGFHPGGPGSIPGVGRNILSKLPIRSPVNLPSAGPYMIFAIKGECLIIRWHPLEYTKLRISLCHQQHMSTGVLIMTTDHNNYDDLCVYKI